jgi:hypothetical protein
VTTNGEPARKDEGEHAPEPRPDDLTTRIDTDELIEPGASEPASAESPRAEATATPPPSPPPSLKLDAVEQPVAYVSLGLTVGDGFKFGCGFALAVLIALVAVFALLSVVFLVASLLNVPIPVSY